MSAPRCFPGRVINHRYRLGETIGKGQVATVFRAHDLRSDRPCAIKILNAESARDATLRRRLAQEGSLSSRLCHPNLPLVYALDEDQDGTPFLVMELLDGPNLHTILRQQGRLSLAQATHVLQQLVRGVRCAHTLGIVHRDLKPQNILLVPSHHDPNERTIDVLQATVKIVDFGLATDTQATRAASISAPLCVDMEYRAPELLGAAALIDARVDQWSLAVIAYEILAGVRPFSDADPVRLALQIRAGRFTPLSLHRPDLPPHVSAAIDRALSVAPRDRFASVEAFGNALQGHFPRMFRVATPAADSAADCAAGMDLFAAVIERNRAGRDTWLLRSLALTTLAIVAFTMPFSWVASVTQRHAQISLAAVETPASGAPVSAEIGPLASARQRHAAIPPLRPADPDPAVQYPPLRTLSER